MVNRIPPGTAILAHCFSNYQWVDTQGSLGGQKAIDEVLDQVISAVENDPISNGENCAAFVEKLCGSGGLSDAARLLRSLHGEQIFLTPKAYNIFLTAVGKEKDFEVLSQIFKDVILFRDILGPDFYHNLAKAFSNSTDSVQLLNFIQEVQEMFFPNRAIIMNKIITGFAETKQIDKALMIFDLMKDSKCKPDLITHNIVLDILGRAGRVDEMVHVFTSMKSSSVVPDVISYNTLINSLRKVGRLELCLAFFQEMFEREVDPDLRTYTAIIDVLGRSGRVEEALGLFEQMKGRGINPSLYIYRSLISNLKKVGKVKMAVSLLEEMNS